jgi:hypothetical protein
MSTSFVACVDGAFQVFESRKDLEEFAKLYLSENPEGEIQFCPWNPAVIKRQVKFEIVGLSAAGTGKGRPAGAMARDEHGNLLRKDGSVAKPMGRKPKDAPSAEAASPESTATVETATEGRPLVRKNGDTLVTASAQ